MPPILEDTAEERVQQRVGEQIVELPVPQMMEETVDVVRLVPQICVHQRIDEQMVEVTTPQMWEDLVGEFHDAPQEQCMERICDQIVDVSVLQVDVLEALKFHVRAVSYEMQKKFSDMEYGEEELWNQKHDLRKQLCICSMKINTLRGQRSGDLGAGQRSCVGVPS